MGIRSLKTGFMQKVKHPLYALPVAAAILALGAVACNNSDYKTSDNSTPDSATTQLNPAASSTPAGQPSATAEPKSTDMDTANSAKSSTPPAHPTAMHHRKKASTSIVMTETVAGATAPQFPGGQRALDSYVNDHINYPQNAIDNDVSGVVRVQFIVDENGKISKAKLISPQKIGEGLDEEALRVVNSMPEWKPGTLHGKRIKTRLELPISFMVES
jgi:TonB family protein